MKDENSSDAKAKLGCICFFGFFALWAIGPILFDAYASNHDNILTKSVIAIVAIIAGVIVLFQVICYAIAMGALLAEVAKWITIRNALMGIGVYFSIIFIIKTIENINEGYVAYTHYMTIGFPFFVVFAMYLIKWVIEIIKDYQEKKMNGKEHKESPTEK